jgi:predicted outer membrane lipoprotein
VPRTRRYPNFTAFIATGAIIGFVLGSLVGSLDDGSSEMGRSYSGSTAVLFLGLLGACVFGLLGALVAVLLDRRR